MTIQSIVQKRNTPDRVNPPFWTWFNIITRQCTGQCCGQYSGTYNDNTRQTNMGYSQYSESLYSNYPKSKDLYTLRNVLHIVHWTTPVYTSTMTIHNGLNNHTLLNAYNHVYNKDTDLKTISIIHQMRVSKTHGYNLKGYETMLLYYDQLLAR